MKTTILDAGTSIGREERGPFVRGRVLDLALAPARELGLVGPGIAHVEVEVVD